MALGTEADLAKEGLTYRADAAHETALRAWTKENAAKIDEAIIRALASLVLTGRAS